MRASSMLVEGNDSNRKTFGLRSILDGRTQLYRTRLSPSHLARNPAGDVDPVCRRGVPDEDVLPVARVQLNLRRRVPRLVLFLRARASQQIGRASCRGRV